MELFRGSGGLARSPKSRLCHRWALCERNKRPGIRKGSIPVKRSAVTRSGTNTSVLAGTCQAVESQCVKTEFKSIPTSVMPRAPRNREERQGRRVAASTCRAVEPKIARTSWCRPCRSGFSELFESVLRKNSSFWLCVWISNGANPTNRQGACSCGTVFPGYFRLLRRPLTARFRLCLRAKDSR